MKASSCGWGKNPLHVVVGGFFLHTASNFAFKYGIMDFIFSNIRHWIKQFRLVGEWHDGNLVIVIKRTNLDKCVLKIN